MTDLNDKIAEITRNITSLKFDVENMMEESYIKFSMLPQETAKLVGNATKLSGEMDELNLRIEILVKRDLQNSTGELKSLSMSLQETHLSMQLVNHFLNVDNEMQLAKKELNEGHYFEAAKKLKNVGRLLKESFEAKPDILSALIAEKSLLEEIFLYDMMEIWKECFKWEEAEPAKDVKKVSLKIDTESLNKIEQMMNALNYFEYLDFKMRKFSNNVLKYLLMPIIMEESNVEVHEAHNLAILEVESKPHCSKPQYTTVFVNVTQIFDFLHSKLNVLIEENVTFLNKLGEMISGEFCECLIKNCLCETIPSNSTDLDAYGIIANATEEFQAHLKDIGFLGSSNQSLLDYAKNIDVLFANKNCQILLGRARDIMKKDLHDMIEVGPITPADNLDYTVNVKPFDSFKPEVKLSNNTFQFPKCYISKSAKELMELVYNILDEAVLSTEFCSVRLFCTARNIFELYCAVIPNHHKMFLETIPQQVALFHNNCMYLAHRLVTLSHEYHDLFPAILKSNTLTFVDQVTMLRELGTSTYLKFMQKQKKQILDILRDSGLATLGEDPKVTPSIEKAIRQCARQLELLQAVWQNVLPVAVYCKSLGCLVNALVGELIIRVTTVEDIPASTAVHLVTVFGIVLERTPQVFQEPKEVHRFVKLWQKFKELVLILSASMRDIEDRWADGKGPLAHEFTPDEVKQLIRALFQNTERRSALLLRIK